MLKHTGLILPAHINENRVMAIAWSPEGSILAAALADNTIYTFQCGVMKHLIRVEPSNTGVAKKTNHSIRDIAFSPDSTKLAVALARGAVHVHKIENDWTCDATLCNEFLQNSPVSCLVWSNKGPIVFGLENGKVRASRIETEMAWTLYSTDSSTLAVAVDDAGTGILSSHADGSIFLYNLTTSDNTVIVAASRVMTRLSAPRALAWARDKILVVDGDGQVAFHDDCGKLLETFDYAQESSTEDFGYACCSSTNSNVVVGLSGKVHLYDWNGKTESWKEMDSSATNVVEGVTAVALRKDGTKLAIGGVRGAVAKFKVTNTLPAGKRPKTAGMLIRNVDSNLVSEISLENDNGLPGSTLWPTTKTSSSKKSYDEALRLRRSTKTDKSDRLLSFQNGTSSSLIAIEPKNKSELVSGFSTWAKKDEQKRSLIDYISSDIASSPDKSSFTMDLGSILSGDESDSAIASRTRKPQTKKTHRPDSCDLFASTIATPLSADGMLFQNLNDVPYDPAVDPPCWRRSELFEKRRSDATRPFCRNCGRLDVTMKDCPRCRDAYRDCNRPSSVQTVVSSPIRFTRQYTPEELRADFTLQLAMLASLSPGLQRILEQQIFDAKVDRGC